MLVCGTDLYDYVQGRCQVDGFVESPVDIAGNKKYLRTISFPYLKVVLALFLQTFLQELAPNKEVQQFLNTLKG